MQLAKDYARKEGAHICPDTAEALKKGSYVDDSVAGGSKQFVDKLVGNVTEENGQFKYDGTVVQFYDLISMAIKVIVRSRETNQAAIEKFGPTFIGHRWDARPDLIKFKPAVNLANRKRKLRTEDDITPENVHLIDEATLTIRVIVGILAAIYDPMGLIAALTVCWKIQLGLLHKTGTIWDEPLSEESSAIWKDILRNIILMEEIVFHQSAQPHGTTGKPGLVLFLDGGKPTSAGVLYMRCQDWTDRSASAGS